MATAITKTLGLKELNSPLDLIKATRKGFKKEAIDDIMEALQINTDVISKFLHVSPRTLQRYDPKKTLPLDTSDHLVQVYRVYSRALEVFNSKDKALRWLKYPSVALGNNIPIDLLDTSSGIEMVLDELGRIEYGIFA